MCGYLKAEREREEEGETDLIADVQGEEQHEHASGRVAPVMSGPVVVDVFKERWVEDLDLEDVFKNRESN